MRVDPDAQLPEPGEADPAEGRDRRPGRFAHGDQCQPLGPIERVLLQARTWKPSRIASTDATAAPSSAIVVNSGLSAATAAARIS